MSNVRDILARLQHVNAVGDGEWMAACPAHRDENASLHITQKGDTTLMKCMAGCETADVLKAMGLDFSALGAGGRTSGGQYGCTLAAYCHAKMLRQDALAAWYVTEGQRRSGNGRQHTGVRIAYRNADGVEVAVRWRMCLSKGTGEGGKDLRFVWDRGNKPCLYGLWRMSEWTRDYIVLVEGESDCQSLWSAGIQAMGLPGASNYKPSRDDRWLDQFHVIYVIIERDKGGEALFESLQKGIIACKCWYTMIPGYKDASDAWCGVAANPSEMQTLMRLAMNNSAPADEFVKPSAWSQPKKDGRAETSARNGERGAQYGERGGRPRADILGASNAFLDTLKNDDGEIVVRRWHEGWWQWEGRKYCPMMDSDMEARVAAFLQDPAVMQEFTILPSKTMVGNVIVNVKSFSMAGVPSHVQNNSWISTGSQDARWSAFGNALVDLEQCADYVEALGEDGAPDDGETATFMRPLTPDFLATTSHGYECQPGAGCPKFLQFLDDVCPDVDVQETIRQMMGSCLVPHSFDKAFIVYGDAGTGKSTFLRILRMVVGEDNCCNVALLDLGEKFRLWPLAEKLVNVVEEMSTDDPLGKMRYIEGDFKNQITGGMITVERKGRDTVFAKCMATHVFATNVLPTFFDKTSGIWDRLVIIPFNQRIRDTGKQVLNFDQTLREELPGILNWALAGLARLRRSGGKFFVADACAEVVALHRERCDQDGTYCREMFYQDNTRYVFLADAYEEFRQYLNANGLSPRSCMTFQTVMQRVWGVKPVPLNAVDRRRIYKGMGMYSWRGNAGADASVL